jgi:hypothetical protein
MPQAGAVPTRCEESKCFFPPRMRGDALNGQVNFDEAFWQIGHHFTADLIWSMRLIRSASDTEERYASDEIWSRAS